MLKRDSLGSAIGAYLTGVAVTSGPWLLTTLVLVLMRISAVRQSVPDIALVEHVITVVYATVLVFTAPIDIVLSRYASDRIYDGEPECIAAPLRRALAVILVLFGGLGFGAMLVIGVPFAFAAPGAGLAVIVAGQWVLLSAAGGLSSPGIILRAFAWGAPISILAAVGLANYSSFGAVGYLYGFAVGQVITLAMLLIGTMRALPAQEDESARIAPAIREYWLLAAAAIVFNAGIWIDKLVVYLMSDGDIASVYAAIAAVAWLSVIPACAYLFIQIETGFYSKFRHFYSILGSGASLSDLDSAADGIRGEAKRILRGTALVQTTISVFGLVLAPQIVQLLGLEALGPRTFQLLVVGSALQVVSLAATVLLYYFDFRLEALLTAAALLVVNAGLTAMTVVDSEMLGIGYAIACAASCAVAIGFVHHRLRGLVAGTFQDQPFGASA